jgi:hypothetical protein
MPIQAKSGWKFCFCPHCITRQQIGKRLITVIEDLTHTLEQLVSRRCYIISHGTERSEMFGRGVFE